MFDFSQITVASVTGLQSVAGGALRSIEFCAGQLPGSRGLLFSPVPPPNISSGIKHVQIKPFGYLEYGLFVLYSLGEFIETDFALIVQDDGWILDAGNWRSEFLNYDYLGAPVHFARIKQDDGRLLYRRGFSWIADMANGAMVENVYNGGFSLRSRRLLNAPRLLGLDFCIPAPNISQAAPYSMQWDSDAALEDVWLCLTAREKLEHEGMRFPELEVAKNFSIEHAAPLLHSADSIQNIFGHHSKIRKIGDLNRRIVNYKIPLEDAESTYGEKWIIDVFIKNGYKINYTSHL